MGTTPTAPSGHSALAPFRHTTYAVVWTATVVANIGGWMYSAAASWLMTTLDPHPVMVSLVQVATTLPMVLFAVPAGALADIIDKRRYLLAVEIGVAVVSAIFAALVMRDLVTPASLLVFMFIVSCGTALDAPAWQSIVPQLVPRQDLSAAVAANSVGINISRAVGPALSGAITATLGVAAPFWIDAASNFATIGALLWWRRPPGAGNRPLPAERLGSAIRAGVRYARNNPPLRATLLRCIAFCLFASAYWALLPLLARSQIGGGPGVYGLLLGAIGAGAVSAAFVLPRLKGMLGPDRLVAAGTIGTALAMVLYAIAHDTGTALAASLIAGACWIACLSTLNVSAQLALPEWVRGRGLAIYVTILFGAISLGSALWGEVAAAAGLPLAHLIASAGALIAIPLTWHWRLRSSAGLDLTPSMHWPEPVLAEDLEPSQGPVMVTVEYRVSSSNREAFLAALDRVAAERRRDGAFAWGVFEDAAQPGRYVETFFVESWMEHLRQHERVTRSDRLQQEKLEALLLSPTKVAHLVAARPDEREGAPAPGLQ